MSEALPLDRRNPSGSQKPQRPGGGPPDDQNAGAGLDLREIFAVLRRRKAVIFGCMVLGAILAAVYVLQIVPRYTAEASVMLETRKTQVLDFQSVLSGLQGDAAVIRSEVEVMKSPTFAGKVAKKLNLETLPEFNPALAPASRFPDPIALARGEVQRLLGRSAPAPATPEEALEARKTAMVRALMGRVEVFNDGRSYIIRIRAQTTDPQLSARIANAYADTYLLEQLDAKFEATRRASAWLNEHLTQLRDKVREAERAVELFREQNNLTETKGTTLTGQQLLDLNSQLMLAAADRTQKESSLHELQELLKTPGAIEASAQVTAAAPLVQKLREQESELMRRQAELSTRYKPAHPTMVNLRAQIEDIRRKIQEEATKAVRTLANDLNVARAKEAALRSTLQGLQHSTVQQDKAQIQLRELEREAQANRALYEDFLTRFKQTTAQEDIQQADARLVASATPPSVPSYPNKTLLLGIALVASLFVGIALAFLIERLDNGFRSADQIESMMGLPTLGLVPMLTGAQRPQDVVVERPVSQYSEAIRSIRTALRYSDIDNPPKVVLVSSSLPSEGKTIFAASLARSVARSRGRALLIDCDFRRPGIGKLFAGDGDSGLIRLFDGGADLDTIIKVDETSGLHYIPNAGGTANPQDLLGSQQMRAFLEKMRTRYDLIVLDAPPVLAVSDPIILSHVADTTLFLVRWEKTPRPVVIGALRSLRANGGNIAGVVLSRVNIRKHAAYGYGDSAYYYRRYASYYRNN